jgi:hypothetical protein
VTVTVSVQAGATTHNHEVEFETAGEPEPFSVGALRHYLNDVFALPSAIAVNNAAQQVYALLGGDTRGAFAVRLIQWLHRSQLRSASVILLSRMDPTLSRLVETGLPAAMNDDAAIRGDINATLSMVDIFWEPALQQVVEQGMSVSFAELLNRTYRSENTLERIGAACGLVLFSRLAERDPSRFLELFSTDQI